MKDNLDTYNFEYWPEEIDEHNIPVRLSFDTNELTFEEFCNLCKSFAFALGFSIETINSYFKEN